MMKRCQWIIELLWCASFDWWGVKRACVLVHANPSPMQVLRVDHPGLANRECTPDWIEESSNACGTNIVAVAALALSTHIIVPRACQACQRTKHVQSSRDGMPSPILFPVLVEGSLRLWGRKWTGRVFPKMLKSWNRWLPLWVSYLNHVLNNYFPDDSIWHSIIFQLASCSILGTRPALQQLVDVVGRFFFLCRARGKKLPTSIRTEIWSLKIYIGISRFT